MALLEIENLYFRYAGAKRNAVNGACLCVRPGEVVALAGKSGCGKSTLCLCACGLAPALVAGRLMGSVKIDGKEVGQMSKSERSLAVGIVFQEPDDQLFSPCEAKLSIMQRIEQKMGKPLVLAPEHV